jgi:3-oxoacyl-[acyl-carrier protein] reductase
MLAVVTGAGGGIGAAVAEVLSADGYHLALVGRREQALQDTAGKIGHGVILPADLNDPDDVAQVAEVVDTADVLVHCAGAIPARDRDDLAGAADWWRATYDANVLTAALLTEAVPVYPGGSVVFVSSIAAQRGGRGPYSAAKAALHGYAMSLARELAPAVTVNVVAPGYVAGTGLFPEPPDEAEMARRVAETLTGRVGTPQDVAEAVRYLIRARHVTGQILAVNGGAVLGR